MTGPPLETLCLIGFQSQPWKHDVEGRGSNNGLSSGNSLTHSGSFYERVYLRCQATTWHLKLAPAERNRGRSICVYKTELYLGLLVSPVRKGLSASWLVVFSHLQARVHFPDSFLISKFVLQSAPCQGDSFLMFVWYFSASSVFLPCFRSFLLPSLLCFQYTKWEKNEIRHW